MSLNNFVEVHTFDQQSSPSAGVVTYYDLDEDIRQMAEVLYTFKDSYLFKVCWEIQAKFFLNEHYRGHSGEEADIVDLKATPEVILNDIFKPCYDDYTYIYNSLKDGSIKLGAVDTLFKDFIGKYSELVQDFDNMCRVDPSDSKQWIQQRALQIQQYHDLHLAVASARVIQTVKETLCLQGDFNILQTLLDVVSQRLLNPFLSLSHKNLKT